jgi:hypothetical protein
MRLFLFIFLIFSLSQAVAQTADSNSSLEGGVSASLTGIALRQKMAKQAGQNNLSSYSSPGVMISYLRNLDNYVSVGPSVSYEYVGLRDKSTGDYAGVQFLNLSVRLKYFYTKPNKVRGYLLFRPGYQTYSLKTNQNIPTTQKSAFSSLNSFTAQAGTGVLFHISNSWHFQIEAAVGRPYFLAAQVLYLLPGLNRNAPAGMPGIKREQQF